MRIIKNIKGNEKFQDLYKKMVHSTYYHKRYEGYMENIVTDVKGRRRIHRVYVGEYYSQDISAKNRVLIRILYIFLYLLSVACFIFVSSRNSKSNYVIFIQIICFLLIMAMLMMMLFLVSYITSPKSMTVWEHYAGPVRIKVTSAAIAILLGIEALAVIIFVIFHSDIILWDEIVNIVGYLIASMSMFLINRVENKIQYNKTLNNNKKFRGGHYIEY